MSNLPQADSNYICGVCGSVEETLLPFCYVCWKLVCAPCWQVHRRMHYKPILTIGGEVLYKSAPARPKPRPKDPGKSLEGDLFGEQITTGRRRR